MIHVEDTEHWDQAAPPGLSVAQRIASFASAVGSPGGGARVSAQFGRWFVDQNDGSVVTPYAAPSSLGLVLANGGNFWCHTHDGSTGNLQTVYMCVASAVAGELGVGIDQGTSHAAGRSGGAQIGSATDWVANAVAVGIRRMNSTVVNYYSTTPESLRPYGMSDADMEGGVWYHDAAPGPFVAGLTTMRQRPFYVNTASVWDEGLGSTYPSTTQVGSLLMIPHPARQALVGYADGRGNERSSQVTIEDFNACLTEIHTTYQNMVTHQNSIVNVWYVHVPPGNIENSSKIATFGAWVQSINAVVGSGGEWLNFNELASLYTNPQSFNW